MKRIEYGIILMPFKRNNETVYNINLLTGMFSKPIIEKKFNNEAKATKYCQKLNKKNNYQKKLYSKYDYYYGKRYFVVKIKNNYITKTEEKNEF